MDVFHMEMQPHLTWKVSSYMEKEDVYMEKPFFRAVKVSQGRSGQFFI